MFMQSIARSPQSAHSIQRLRQFCDACARPLGMALCAFLFSMVRWLGIPSPFAAAYLISQNARGYQAIFPLLGLVASFAFRLCWGVSLELWQYVGCLLIWLVLWVKRPQTQWQAAALAGLSMLPGAVAAALRTEIGWASLTAVPLCMGATLWLRRGLDRLQTAHPVTQPQDAACCVLPLLLWIAGAGYLQLWSVNLGYVLATALTLSVAFALGGVVGGSCGLLVGLSLSLSGHSSLLVLVYGLSGLLAGLLQRRRWCCMLGFGAGLLICAYLTPELAPPVSAVCLGCAAFLPVREQTLDKLRALASVGPRESRSAESAFLQTRLNDCENALRSMMRALPAVSPQTQDTRGDQELMRLMCGDCSEKKRCHAENKPEPIFRELWRTTQKAGESNLLPEFTLNGCARIHALPELLERVQREERARQALRAKTRFHREMTLTHLDAMSSTVGELRRQACGETLHDLQAACQIEQTIHALHFPGKLRYARRVEGRLCAELECEPLISPEKSLERLLHTLAREHSLQLSVARSVRNRIELEELPLYSVELGVASICAGQQTAQASVCGDALIARALRGGRYLLALSDGMGHGEHAQSESQQALELLMLSLEAGYTRRQAITTVNGMMLTTRESELFSTIDLFDLSLWTGDACSDKLGAAPSFIVRGNYIKRIEGDSLPIGILESVSPASQSFRLHSGDILVIVSDGVADVFSEPQAAERAIAESLYIQPQRMADALLRSALLASGGTPRDDMTVATLLLVDRKRSLSFEAS